MQGPEGTSSVLELDLTRLVGSEIVCLCGKMCMMVYVDFWLGSGGLDKQAGATDLLLAKRSFWLVVALRAGNTVILCFDTSLQTASTLVMKGVALRLVLVTGAFFAFAFIEANTQIVFCVKLRRDI